MIRFSSLRWSPIRARLGRFSMNLAKSASDSDVLRKALGRFAHAGLNLNIARQVAVGVEAVRQVGAGRGGADAHLVGEGGMPHTGNHRRRVLSYTRADRHAAIDAVEVEARRARVLQILFNSRRIGRRGVPDVRDLAIAIRAGGELVVEELPPVGKDGRQRRVGFLGIRRALLDHQFAEPVELADGRGPLGKVVGGVAGRGKEVAEIGGGIDGEVGAGRRCRQGRADRRFGFQFTTMGLESYSHLSSPSSVSSCTKFVYSRIGNAPISPIFRGQDSANLPKEFSDEKPITRMKSL